MVILETLTSYDASQPKAAAQWTSEDPREELKNFMRGSLVTIPNLQKLMCHWPAGVHPEIERLDKAVQTQLHSSVP
jgi:hypothetical protein